MEDVRLKELISSLSKSNKCDVDAAIEQSECYVRQGGGKRAHSYLCAAALQGAGVGGKACSRLLRCLGPAQALVVAYSSAPRMSLTTARWLAREVESLVDQTTQTLLLYEECCVPSSTLSPDQEQLLLVLVHMPDRLANKLGRSLPSFLLPFSVFSRLGRALLGCLCKVHADLKDSQDRSLAFPEAVLSKAAVLGHAETVLSQLVPTLEQRSGDDPLWRRVSHSLFSRVSNSAVDPLLTALVQQLLPSLANPHPLYWLLGNLAQTNHRVRLILTQKMWLTRLPSNQSAVYNLIGYLMSWDEGRVLLGKSLQSALGVWSDGACVRRMDNCHHLWLCKLLVLGTTCLASHMATPTSSALRGGVMRGLQVHLDSALPGTRERGMAVGQCLMNCLHSVPTEQQLHFDLGENSDVVAILKLSRPVSEQQVALKSTLPPHSPDPSPVVHVREAEGGERVQGGGVVGEGMATVREASDSDSDNELEPFDMSHDPDHTHKPAPRYLRDCLSVLVSQSDSGSVEAALSSLPALLSPAPADLSEVCVELARVLLHCQDTWAIPSFSSLRHTALVALTTSRPHLLAPYLTTEFYSPNHNTRQRLDILEVLSSAATDLSTPSPLTTHTPSPLSSPTLTQSDRPDKPWQQVIDERVRAKTRVISKGPQKVPPPSTPSKFSPVAPLFFFPLMAPYDHALPTLDLLGRDSVLLGHMVRTLGHVVWCACHSPSEPAMARALLEFVWALRYHPSSNVRQAVLCAVSMVIVTTPPNFLLSDMHEVIAEATLWVQDLCSSDGDDEVRALASHALSLLAAISG